MGEKDGTIPLNRVQSSLIFAKIKDPSSHGKSPTAWEDCVERPRAVTAKQNGKNLMPDEYIMDRGQALPEASVGAQVTKRHPGVGGGWGGF